MTDSQEFIINNSKLVITVGDIVTSHAEVIVSSDDTRCTMGDGVSLAILRQGGETIYEDVQKNIPAEMGDVLITTAGKLPQKYIFHCITLFAFGERLNQGMQGFIIERAIDKCMKLMPLLGVSSIAFPLIGSGSAAFSVSHEFVMLADLFTKHLLATNRSYNVEIYVYEGNSNSHNDFSRLCECFDYSLNQYQDTRERLESIVETAKPIGRMIASHFKEHGAEYVHTLAKQIMNKTSAQQAEKMSVKKPTDDHDVFISYSRQNTEFALLFGKEMDDLGISYWYDIDGMYSGDNFKDVLVDAIDKTKLLLFISSKESNDSPNVRKEISLAVAGNKRILPIRIDDTPYAKSIRYDLSDIDWIDYVKEEHDKVMQKFRYCLQLYLQ